MKFGEGEDVGGGGAERFIGSTEPFKTLFVKFRLGKGKSSKLPSILFRVRVRKTRETDQATESLDFRMRQNRDENDRRTGKNLKKRTTSKDNE